MGASEFSVPFRTALTAKSLSALDVATIATVWTPATGKKVRLLGMTISSTTAIHYLFEDNAAGTFVYRTPQLLAITPFTIVFPGSGFALSAVDRVLKATGSAAGLITGTLFGVEE